MGFIFPCLPEARIKRHFVSQLVNRFTQSPLPRRPIQIWIVDPDGQAIASSGGNLNSPGTFSGEDSSTNEAQ